MQKRNRFQLHFDVEIASCVSQPKFHSVKYFIRDVKTSVYAKMKKLSVTRMGLTFVATDARLIIFEAMKEDILFTNCAETKIKRVKM